MSDEVPTLTGEYLKQEPTNENSLPVWTSTDATVASTAGGNWIVSSPNAVLCLLSHNPHFGVMPDSLKPNSTAVKGAALWSVSSGNLGSSHAAKNTRISRDATKWKGWKKESQVKTRGIAQGYASAFGNKPAKALPELSKGGSRRTAALRHATTLPKHQQYFPEQIEHSAAVSIEKSAKLLVFGGQKGAAQENELYQLLPSSLEWRRREGKGTLPWGRHGHTLSNIGKHIFLIGGVGTGGVGQSPTDDPSAVEIEVADIAPGVASPAGNRQLYSEEDVWGTVAKAAQLDTEETRLATELRTQMGRPAGRRVRNAGFVRHLYRMDTKTGVWSLVLTDMSVFVVHHAAAAVGHEIFLFGGVGLDRKCTNAMKVLDTGVRCYYCKSQAHALVPLETRRVVFGGKTKVFTFNQLFDKYGDEKANMLWEAGTPEPVPQSLADTRPPKNAPCAWVCGEHLREEHGSVSFAQRSGRFHWRSVVGSGEAPAPRYLHTMERFNNELLVFGGLGGVDDGNDTEEKFLPADTYSFCLATHTWSKIETNNGPTPRFGHATCIAGAHMIVTGGCIGQLRGSVSGYISNDIWSLNLYTQTWRKLSARGVPRLRNHVVSVMPKVDGVDTDGPVLVLFGGLFQEHDSWFVGDDVLAGDEDTEFYYNAIPESEAEFANDPPLGPVVKGSQGWYAPFHPKMCEKKLLQTNPDSVGPPGVGPGHFKRDESANHRWLGPLTVNLALSTEKGRGFDRRVIEVCSSKIDSSGTVGTFLGGEHGNVCLEDTPSQARRERGVVEPAHFFNGNEEQRTVILEHLTTNYTWVIPLEPIAKAPSQQPKETVVPPTLEKRIERLYGQKKKTEAHVHRLRELLLKDSIANSEAKIFPKMQFVEDFDDMVDQFQVSVVALAEVPQHKKLSGAPVDELKRLADETRVIGGKLKQASELALRRVTETENDGAPPRPLQLWAVQEHIKNCGIALSAFIAFAKVEVPNIPDFGEYRAKIKSARTELANCRTKIATLAQRDDKTVEAWYEKMQNVVKDRKEKGKALWAKMLREEQAKVVKDFKTVKERNAKAVETMQKEAEVWRNELAKHLVHGLFMTRFIEKNNLKGATSEAVTTVTKKKSALAKIFVKSHFPECSGLYTKTTASSKQSPYAQQKTRVIWQHEDGKYFIARAPGQRWAIGRDGHSPVHVTEEKAVGLPVKYPWCTGKTNDAGVLEWVADDAVEVRQLVKDRPAQKKAATPQRREVSMSPPPPPPPPREWVYPHSIGDLIVATREIVFANGGRVAPGDLGEVTSVPGYAEDSPCQVKISGFLFSAQADDITAYAEPGFAQHIPEATGGQQVTQPHPLTVSGGSTRQPRSRSAGPVAVTAAASSRAGSSTRMPGEAGGGQSAAGAVRAKQRSKLTPGQMEIQRARKANTRGVS